MRQEYERTIAEWKEQFELEQAKRQQEGGNWNQELEDAVQRERDALKRLHQVTTQKEELQIEFDKLNNQYSSLKERFESALEATKEAQAREKKAQDELDESTTLHTKQMAQRQRRETELEQTIAQLGSALSMAKQQQTADHASTSDAGVAGSRQQPNSQQQKNDNVNYKDRWEQATEELENIQVQLNLEVQRREALQGQLQEISQERAEEASMEQARQQQHDRKVAELESAVSRLQASLRSYESGQVANGNSITNARGDSNLVQSEDSPAPSAQQLDRQLEEAKREISKLSEQLLRQQGVAENSKSEILALKGRLQAAVARAEEAEKAQFTYSQSTMGSSSALSRGLYQMEAGGDGGKSAQAFTSRRRVKGRAGGVRSIRSALRLGPGRSPGMEQVAMTIDAVDSWMVDTGSFMKNEPLARLGFLLYLLTLHVWSFALVVFHTTEVEHGDFGSMDSNPRHWREHNA